MEIIPPSKTGYTIYTKEKCVFCEKVKQLLVNEKICRRGGVADVSDPRNSEVKDARVCIIPCDDYLLENREEFLYFMEDQIGSSYKTFPMVFLDGQFIGGYTETRKKYLIDHETLSSPLSTPEFSASEELSKCFSIE